jgi:hypothetical protein
MANYLARVELQDAVAEDYVRLDAAMRMRGYVRGMAGEDGANYLLPSGTYYVPESSALSEVALRAAVDAAGETGKQAAIFVVDWRVARWSGLTKI